MGYPAVILRRWGIPFIILLLAGCASHAQVSVRESATSAAQTGRGTALTSPLATGQSRARTSTSLATSTPRITLEPSLFRRSPTVATNGAAAVNGFGHAPLYGQRGVTVLLGADTNFGSKAVSFLDHLAGLGVDSVSAVVIFQQSTYTSSDPQLESSTATPAEIQTLINDAHQRGISVMIRPLMDDTNIIAATNGAQWRGTVLPTDPAAWFSAYYNNVVQPYASLAGIDAFDLGSELTTLAFTFPNRWSSLITTLRSQFPALRLIYSSGFDWTALPGQPQPYPSFAPSLDLLGVDAFFPLNGVTNGYIPSQLVQAWQPWLSKMQQLSAYYRRSIVFTEIGLASQCCTLTQPFVYRAAAAPNMLAQSTYYQAACEAIRPYHIGLFWWAYGSMDPVASPLSDNSFTPYGKPAEQEMARCYTSGY